MSTTRTFDPYIPGPDAPDYDAPFTPNEQAMADELWKLLRQIAHSCSHGELTGPAHLRSEYVFTVSFHEGRPADARVYVYYRASEPSSGYSEHGVGPDFGTAFSRLSDDDATNGVAALDLER